MLRFWIEPGEDEEGLEGSVDVIFVLDHGGGICSSGIQLAKTLAILIINIMTMNTNFSVVSFESSYYAIFPVTVVYKMRHLQ